MCLLEDRHPSKSQRISLVLSWRSSFTGSSRCLHTGLINGSLPITNILPCRFSYSPIRLTYFSNASEMEKATAERQDMKIFVRNMEVTALAFDDKEIEKIAGLQGRDALNSIEHGFGDFVTVLRISALSSSEFAGKKFYMYFKQ